MHKFTGKWITDEEFYCLKPRNVFHRDLEKADLPCDEHRNRHILFRKKFTLDKIPENAKIYITADDYYKLYINGKFVGQGPASGYHFSYNYNVIDITDYLSEGENTLAVHTLYQGLINRTWQSGDNRHGLLIDLYVDDKLALCSDETFKTCRHSAYTESGYMGKFHKTGFMETYDSRAREAGFEKPQFDDSYWTNALISKTDDHILKDQKSKMLEFEKILPDIIKDELGRRIYDFRSNYAGYFVAAAKGRNGDVVTIRCGQELNDDGSVRYNVRATCVYEEKWVLDDGESRLDQFDYKSFRYVELEYPRNVTFEDVHVLARHYPFELKAKMKSEFSGSEKIKAIWDLCVHTQKYGVQEAMLDCMEREKGFYMTDGSVTSMTNMILTDDDSMVRKIIDDGLDSGYISEALLTNINSSNMQEIAEAPLMLTMLILRHYRFTGDKEYLKTNYYEIIKAIEYYRTNYEKDGIISNLDKWSVVEWPPNFRDGYDVNLEQNQVCEQPHVEINAWYLKAIKCLNEMAEILGYPPYRDINPILDAFYKMFYNKEKHLFKDGRDTDHISMVGNSFVFGLGLSPEKEFDQAFIEMLKERKISTIAMACAHLILTGLYALDRTDLVKECLEDENAWCKMIREGATTTFEAWGKEDKWNNSLFHPTLSYAATYIADIDHKKLI